MHLQVEEFIFHFTFAALFYCGLIVLIFAWKTSKFYNVTKDLKTKGKKKKYDQQADGRIERRTDLQKKIIKMPAIKIFSKVKKSKNL